MAYYDIAGLRVCMQPAYPTLQKQAQPYLSADQQSPAAITVIPDAAYLAQKQAQTPYLSMDDCEYIWTGAAFYEALLAHDGFVLHSSAVMLDGKAYLFSAPSGTGKSTHTSLWTEHFGADRARILNDDKPALRCIDGRFYACGTPFSGKTDLSVPCVVPLQGVCLLERAQQNSITRLSTAQALHGIMEQTIRPANAADMEKLLRLLDGFFRTVPIYRLGCNISRQAVVTAYTAMHGGEQV